MRYVDSKAVDGLELLAVSDLAGVYMAISEDRRQIFLTGHPEYDRLTLKAEFNRDLSRGLPIELPRHYFPDDDPARDPVITWRSHANLLCSNWLSYCVYQSTPYDLSRLPDRAHSRADRPSAPAPRPDSQGPL